jgi:membrane associated rhomboid family serine protease
VGPGVFGPVPPAIWLMVLAVLAVEAVLQAGAAGLAGGPEAIGWRLAALQRHGFSGLHWQWLTETGRWRGPEALRLLSYSFVQEGALQAVFVAVLLLALGKAVSEAVGGWRAAALALAAAVAGALAAALVWPQPLWLAGGYPAVFGLLGGFGWSAAAGRGMFEGAEPARRRRALALVALFLLLRAGLGLAAGLGQEAVADLTACAVGAGLAALWAPGAGGRLLARLRRR